jgi:hypothetical protein
MARYNEQADLRQQQIRASREKDRMIEKHYGSWTQYTNQCVYAESKGRRCPPSPEQLLREENPHSGF